MRDGDVLVGGGHPAWHPMQHPVGEGNLAVVPGLLLCGQGPLAGIPLAFAQGSGIGDELIAKLFAGPTLAFRHLLGGLAADNQDDEGVVERNRR